MVFCEQLEKAVIDTVRKGHMTKDLALCIVGGTSVDRSKYLTTTEFMKKVAETQAQYMAGATARL